MMDLKIEGDLNDVNERQKEFVIDVLTKRGFKNGTVHFESFGQAGDNYMANMKRISVKEDGITFKIIAKFAPTMEFMRTMSFIELKYFNEHLMYTEILPKFVGMQKEANVPKIDQFRFPECYGTLFEDKSEVILLEDLKEANFEMLDRFNSLSNASVKLVLKNLAVFHSFSFVLRKIEPDTFIAFKNQISKSMLDVLDSEAMKMFFQQVTGMAMMIVDDEHKSIVLDTMTNFVVRGKENLEAERKSGYSVIQHGDVWTNNVLFKIENFEPVECCLIDYQQTTENSPIEDIYHLILGCTDYETRSKNYHSWMDFYHSELAKSLSYFKLNVEEIYPKSVYESDLKKHLQTGFGIGLVMNLMMMRESKEISAFMDKLANANSLGDFSGSIQELFKQMDFSRLKQRIDGLIKTVLELGYF